MKSDHIIEWRETIVQLPDSQFFNLMRLYLGEIKTPFNKQKLIEQLSAFLRKSKTKEIIRLGLDPFDIEILSAILLLKKSTQKELSSFFYPTYDFPTLYARLLNLEERLIIYLPPLGYECYSINPLIKDEIKDLLDKNVFLEIEKNKDPHKEPPLFLTDVTIGALYSFLLHEQNIIKLDGSLKKKTEALIESIFPELSLRPQIFKKILFSLQNLGLLYRTETCIVLQESRWELFSRLSLLEKNIYLVVAATEKMQYEDLFAQAQVFLNFLTALNLKYIYKKDGLERYFKILCDSIRPTTPFDGVNSGPPLKKYQFTAEKKSLLSIAIDFDLLIKTEAGISVNPLLFSLQEKKQPVIINSSLEATILPETPLASFFPLLQVVEPVVIQTTGLFEITKKAVTKYFEKNYTDENLSTLLQEQTENRVPQNILATITQWYKKTTAIRLYHGYVISVIEQKEKIVYTTPELKKLIRKKLAEGIYLLKDVELEEIKEATEQTGLEFLFSIDKKEPAYKMRELPALTVQESADIKEIEKEQKNRKKQQAEHYKLYNAHIKKLEDLLQKTPLEKEDKKLVKDKILRRIIIDETQVAQTIIRTTKIEASGIDFLGKIRLAETALSSKSFLEITIDDNSKKRTLLGTPTHLEKQEHDVKITFCVEPHREIEEISIARAIKIKLIQRILFS